MEAYIELMEPLFSSAAGLALPTAHFTNPCFEPLPPAIPLFCSATNSLSRSALPMTYLPSQLSEFRSAADILWSPSANIIPDHQQFHHHRDVQCLCPYSCSSHFSEDTPRVSAGGDEEKRREGGGAKQSMAARERRRKITAKTQELGKLIPGAHKMNTAQMLQAASKYVKFLQAQLALLQQMAAFHHQGRNETLEAEELPVLLASSAIQEKLYLEEKCLAPKQFLLKLDSIEAVDLQVL